MARGIRRRYYLYRAAITTGFIAPVFSLFVLRSLTYTEFGTLSGIFAVLVVAGEVPTGYVGDRIGRRASMFVGVCCAVASLLGFVVADSFLAFAVLYALWAFAWTFRSGSADAWLYDALEERADASEFSRVRGRAGAVQRWAGAATMIGGGALYGLDPRLPFVAGAGLNAIGGAVLLTLPANERAGRDDGLAIREALPLVRRRFLASPLRSFVALAAVFFGGIGAAMTYIQPMAIEAIAASAAAAAGEAGAAEALGLGLLYAAFTAVAALASDRAGSLDDRFGPRRALVAVSALTGALLVLPPAIPLLAVPTFFAMHGSQAVLKPLVNQYVNDRVGSAARATVLSAVSMCTALVRAPLAIAAGVVAEAATATVAVAALGGFVLVTGGTIAALGASSPGEVARSTPSD